MGYTVRIRKIQWSNVFVVVFPYFKKNGCEFAKTWKKKTFFLPYHTFLAWKTSEQHFFLYHHNFHTVWTMLIMRFN